MVTKYDGMIRELSWAIRRTLEAIEQAAKRMATTPVTMTPEADATLLRQEAGTVATAVSHARNAFQALWRRHDELRMELVQRGLPEVEVPKLEELAPTVPVFDPPHGGRNG